MCLVSATRPLNCTIPNRPSAAGLQIARWKSPVRVDTTNDSASDIDWRRLFRSLIFMDCWLAYTLGYPSEVTPLDIAVSDNIPVVVGRG